MFKRRETIALSFAAIVVLSAALTAQKKDDKKPSDAQKREVQDVVKIADLVSSGQAAPNDLGLAWVHQDFLKATGNKEYVPFTVSLDTSKVASPNIIALYWRVVDKAEAAAQPVAPTVPAAAAAPTATAGKDDKKKDDKKDEKKDEKKGPRYAYEDITFVPVMAGQAVTRISRSFTVPAGEYDVFVVAKEPASQQKGAPAPKTSVVKQTVMVPDFWNNEFNTSSVIVAQKIEPLNAPLSPQDQIERPYALLQMEIVPTFETKFTKSAELSTFMLIYNAKADAMNKPDIIVEYNFYVKPAGAAEKFFNKTNPQPLNAQTLPPQFDMAAGHQLQSGQAVPLMSFPEGDYRLEIKVTDKLANKTLTRDVNFTVTAG